MEGEGEGGTETKLREKKKGTQISLGYGAFSILFEKNHVSLWRRTRFLILVLFLFSLLFQVCFSATFYSRIPNVPCVPRSLAWAAAYPAGPSFPTYESGPSRVSGSLADTGSSSRRGYWGPTSQHADAPNGGGRGKRGGLALAHDHDLPNKGEVPFSVVW